MSIDEVGKEMIRDERQQAKETRRLNQRRYEIARSAASALIRYGHPADGTFAKELARKSVEFADALIAELQKSTTGAEGGR
jgi:hypothetical protein